MKKKLLSILDAVESLGKNENDYRRVLRTFSSQQLKDLENLDRIDHLTDLETKRLVGLMTLVLQELRGDVRMAAAG
ncbi:MAG: hypothetical protein HQL82_01810 [Magnetococcales bacterium]|nr:hypothetical protein [Magnetococcales bacterium]